MDSIVEWIRSWCLKIFLFIRTMFEPIEAEDNSYSPANNSSNTYAETIEKNNGNIFRVINNAENDAQRALQENETLSTGMLINCLHAPHMINAISILLCMGRDVSLVTEETPLEKLKPLNHPTSLRACLLQVSTSIKQSYYVAHRSMITICGSLKDFPEHFIEIFEIYNKKHITEKDQNNLTAILDLVNEDTEECEKVSTAAHTKLNDVLNLLNVLIGATIVIKSNQTKQNDDIVKQKEVLNVEKESLEEFGQKLKNDFDEGRKREDKTGQAFRSKTESTALENKMILADVITEVGKSAIKCIPANATSTVIKITEEFVKQNTQKTITNAYECAEQKRLLQILESVGDSIQPDMSAEKINGYIRSLKDYEKKTFSSPEGRDLVTKAKELVTLLAKMKENPVENTSMAEELECLKSSVFNCVSACKIAFDEKEKLEKEERQAKMRLDEKLIEADTEKVRMLKEHYKDVSEDVNKIRSDYLENIREFRRVIKEITRAEISSNNLTECITYIQNALIFLTKVNANWEAMTNFFSSVKHLIKEDLYKHVKRFNVHRESERTVSMLREAFKVVAASMQIRKCAAVYSVASQNYIIPIINQVPNNLVSDDQEMAKKKLEQFEFEIKDMDTNFKTQIQSTQNELRSNYFKEINDFRKELNFISQSSKKYN